MRYFSSPGSLRRPMYSVGDDPKGPGFPIRISTDQSSFAAPHGFSQRTTSFIASRCQGIHQTPLRRLIDPTSNGQRPGKRLPRPQPQRRDLVSIIVTQSARPNDPAVRYRRSTPYDEYAEPSPGPGSPGHHALHHVQQPARGNPARMPRPDNSQAGQSLFPRSSRYTARNSGQACVMGNGGPGKT